MKRVILLASDTPHRRFFIKSLINRGIKLDAVLFETSSIKPPFDVSPFMEQEEHIFEKENFFRAFNESLESIETHYVHNINDEESKSIICAKKPDAALVFGTRKIASSTLGLFRDFCLNVHRGIAEEYRGLDTNMWAVYHSDFLNIGVTIHKIDNSLDTGEIVFQERVIYPLNTKVYQMRFYETLKCVELAEKALRDYESGKMKSREQNKRGRYYSFMPLVIKKTLPQKLEFYKPK